MRKFRVNVNGTFYDVEVEEIGASASAQPEAKAAPAPAAQAAPAPKSAPAPSGKPAPVPASGTQIKCPMPGSILAVKVAVGDSVSEGDILLMLEAMKMENEIVSPVSGKVTAVQIAKGSAVNTGDLLIVIE